MPDDDTKELRDVFLARQFTRTSSAEHKKLSMYWVRECCERHPNCGSGKQPSFLPHRLVRITDSAPNPLLRIHKSTDLDSGSEYTTLSHCWGNAKDITRLTSATLTLYEADIPFASLPATFRDAVQITIGLGLHFLWIDSLCIIQDSPDDWAKESLIMDEIYSNSLCTIAAASAANPHQGCFVTRDVLRATACKISEEGGEGVYITPMRGGDNTPVTVVQRSPLVSRAWVLQERLLSRRMLHFGSHGLFWTCRQGMASEHTPAGSGSITPGHVRPIFGDRAQPVDWRGLELPIQGHSLFEDLVGGPPPSTSDVPAMLLFNRRWLFLVRIYSRCQLTVPTDKLVAISGLARRVQRATGFAYLAGLWREALPFNLCWQVYAGARPPPADYRAPSWSWAARDGEILPWKGLTDRIAPLASLVAADDVATHPGDGRGLRVVTAARLTLEGAVKQVQRPRFFRSAEAGTAERPHRLFDGDAKLGSFFWDSPIAADEAAEMHLLPLLRCLPSGYADDGHDGALPEWKEVCGLVLLPTLGELDSVAEFRRIGFFQFYCRRSELDAFEWFDSAPRKQVAIV